VTECASGELTAGAAAVATFYKRASGLPFNMRRCITAEAEAQFRRRLFHSPEHPVAPEPCTPMEWFERIAEYKCSSVGLPPYETAVQRKTDGDLGQTCQWTPNLSTRHLKASRQAAPRRACKRACG
jgi:hypothetical protein